MEVSSEIGRVQLQDSCGVVECGQQRKVAGCSQRQGPIGVARCGQRNVHMEVSTQIGSKCKFMRSRGVRSATKSCGMQSTAGSDRTLRDAADGNVQMEVSSEIGSNCKIHAELWSAVSNEKLRDAVNGRVRSELRDAANSNVQMEVSSEIGPTARVHAELWSAECGQQRKVAGCSQRQGPIGVCEMRPTATSTWR